MQLFERYEDITAVLADIIDTRRKSGIVSSIDEAGPRRSSMTIVNLAGNASNQRDIGRSSRRSSEPNRGYVVAILYPGAFRPLTPVLRSRAAAEEALAAIPRWSQRRRIKARWYRTGMEGIVRVRRDGDTLTVEDGE